MSDLAQAARSAVDQQIRQVGIVKAGVERRVAAILFTYRCTITCRHCLFGCGGRRPNAVMDPPRARLCGSRVGPAEVRTVLSHSALPATAVPGHPGAFGNLRLAAT